MALFGKKKATQDAEGEAPEADVLESGDEEGEVQTSPQKAAAFFDHARAMHTATNYEYAMQLWLNGLRQDPSDLGSLEAFFESAAAFRGTGKGKSGPSKDIRRAVSGKGLAGVWVRALLDWAYKPADPFLAVKATELTSKLGLAEPTYWVGERAMAVVSRDKKPRRDLYLKLMAAFEQIGAFDKAVQSGEAALAIDNSDGKLGVHVRNLAAQATMSQGGFEDTGQAGGFRANIRDAEKQKQLADEDKIVKTEETVDRLIEKAAEDYRSRPDDPAAINLYSKRLLERGRPEDEEEALRVLQRAFEETKSFRFRQRVGEIRIRRARRKLLQIKEQADRNPEDATAQQNLAKAQHQFVSLEVEELSAQHEAYPTDLSIQFELGKRHFALGHYEEAIAFFQEAQKEQKNQVPSLNFLALAFYHIEWIDESVATFRKAIEANHESSRNMELQYGLLMALQAKAEKERTLAAAEEADSIASAIAIQQINYREIRQRRDAIKKLLTELRQS